jgi:hypothetical protein
VPAVVVVVEMAAALAIVVMPEALWSTEIFLLQPVTL